ncbi:putative G-protein coupled receptor 101 [Frankliniella fusca]|uniref:G-protein coupled receptor 101 n=1 Tax=Frankliniella fusca TaxID=407009 RepID=A0AAE1LGV4_9NEOP|nr:putative G-protein coupled receptor 101 [Frankliniella fusca]
MMFYDIWVFDVAVGPKRYLTAEHSLHVDGDAPWLRDLLAAWGAGARSAVVSTRQAPPLLSSVVCLSSGRPRFQARVSSVVLVATVRPVDLVFAARRALLQHVRTHILLWTRAGNLTVGEEGEEIEEEEEGVEQEEDEEEDEGEGKEKEEETGPEHEDAATTTARWIASKRFPHTINQVRLAVTTNGSAPVTVLFSGVWDVDEPNVTRLDGCSAAAGWERGAADALYAPCRVWQAPPPAEPLVVQIVPEQAPRGRLRERFAVVGEIFRRGRQGRPGTDRGRPGDRERPRDRERRPGDRKRPGSRQTSAPGQAEHDRDEKPGRRRVRDVQRQHPDELASVPSGNPGPGPGPGPASDPRRRVPSPAPAPRRRGPPPKQSSTPAPGKSRTNMTYSDGESRQTSLLVNGRAPFPNREQPHENRSGPDPRGTDPVPHRVPFLGQSGRESLPGKRQPPSPGANQTSVLGWQRDQGLGQRISQRIGQLLDQRLGLDEFEGAGDRRARNRWFDMATFFISELHRRMHLDFSYKIENLPVNSEGLAMRRSLSCRLDLVMSEEPLNASVHRKLAVFPWNLHSTEAVVPSGLGAAPKPFHQLTNELCAWLWAAVALAVLTVAVALICLGHRDPALVALKTLSPLLSQAVAHPPRFIQRPVFGGWLLTSLVLSAAYQGELLGELTVSSKPNIDSVQQLNASGLPVLFWKEWDLESYPLEHWQLEDQVVFDINSTMQQASRWAIDFGNVSFFRDKDNRGTTGPEGTDLDDRRLHTFSLPMTRLKATYITMEGSPYEKPLRKFLGRIRAAGLTIQSLQSSYISRPRHGHDRGAQRAWNDSPRPLTYAQVEPALQLLALCLTLAFVVFVAERAF